MALTFPSRSASQEAAASIFVEKIRAGDVRALSRAISLVENESDLAPALLSACFPHTGHALRIGLTGAPGAGKSTLADQLVQHYRAQHQTVGVVAVDPTSPYSGGAILGDRIRMNRHHADPGLYLRSMATRGALGGLARASADIASMIEASGKERVIIETVGVGQDEIDIVRLADVTVVILVPGLGDDIQSMKAGILEIADIFVINKSDHEGADRLEQELLSMQSLRAQSPGVRSQDSRSNTWVPAVLHTVASTGQGTAALAEAIEQCGLTFRASGRLQDRRTSAWGERLLDIVHQKLTRELVDSLVGRQTWQAHLQAIARGHQDPYRLVDVWLQDLLSGRSVLHEEKCTAENHEAKK